jgi:hypothetical protein
MVGLNKRTNYIYRKSECEFFEKQFFSHHNLILTANIKNLISDFVICNWTTERARAGPLGARTRVPRNPAQYATAIMCCIGNVTHFSNALIAME